MGEKEEELGEKVVEGIGDGVEEALDELEGMRVDWGKSKVFWLLELGSHIPGLLLLLGELAGDLDQSFPVVAILVS